MPIRETPDKANEESAKAAEVTTFDPKTSEGFHVMRGKDHLGTYGSTEDAQAFIDGQLVPQDITDASIVEGTEQAE